MASISIAVDSSEELFLKRAESESEFLALVSLYESAFPLSERRPIDAFAQIFKDKRAEFWIISEHAHAIGFLNTWRLSGCLYGEHFAVLPELRGRKVGERALSAILHREPKPFVVEVEPPDTPIAKRRIDFYERLGLEVVEQNYYQPPYAPDRPGIPLHLMATKNSMQGDRVERVVREIRSVIYEEF